MKNETLFEQAIQRMQAGENFSDVCRGLPLELQEMLKIVTGIQQSQLTESFNLQQQAAHKRKVLSQAAQQYDTRPYFGFGLLTRLAMVVLLFVVSLTFTGLASAQSLPGDMLYSVKRSLEQVQLNLTADSGKVQLEEVFDARRVNEVQKMRQEQRWGPVQFAGWLAVSPKGNWLVENIPLVSESVPHFSADRLVGTYVEVKGTLQPDGVFHEELQLRLFNLDGQLQIGNEGGWLIDGKVLEISPEARIRGELREGSQAEITAFHVLPDRYVALLIIVSQQNLTEVP